MLFSSLSLIAPYGSFSNLCLTMTNYVHRTDSIWPVHFKFDLQAKYCFALDCRFIFCYFLELHLKILNFLKLFITIGCTIIDFFVQYKLFELSLTNNFLRLRLWPASLYWFTTLLFQIPYNKLFLITLR